MSDKTFMLRRPFLEIHWPDGKIQEYDLKLDLINIGRQEGANQIDIPNTSRSISRQHCQILRKPEGYQLIDRKSRNGVFVNGNRLTAPHLLQPDDEITIGTEAETIRMIFHSPAHALNKIQIPTAEISAVEGILSEHPADSAYLSFRWDTTEDHYFSISKEVTLIGRDPASDLDIPPALNYVSGRHIEIRKRLGEYEIVDLDSTNGTLLNGNWLTPNQATPLHDGDIIRMGDPAFGVSTGFTFHAPSIAHPLQGFSGHMDSATILEQPVISIGRSPENTIPLNSPIVSRFHARVEKKAEGDSIIDNRSLNGTYVNGTRVTSATLTNGDQIKIGPFILLYQDSQLTRYDSQGMRVDVVDLSNEYDTRQGKVRFMDGINFSVKPREFIAIVGGSGAGKTTLMNALIGLKPADGKVLLNGQDFYEDVEQFRPQMGYVPQTDILHTSLTVEQALTYTAQLRMPPDTSKKEHATRITEALETVSMNNKFTRAARIKNLSGGQRKRVSIASELLADPKLFYLDEPTSGLDPGLEKKMMFTLRRMADQGRTVILITHATANIIQVDHVAFLSQGKLVYFGPPQEALEFFGVSEFADIYEQIDKRGAEWKQTFEHGNPKFYQKHVLERFKDRQVAVVKEKAGKAKQGIKRFFQQLSVLTRRALKIQTADMLTLGLMVALYPFTATLQLLIASSDVLIGDPAIFTDPVRAALTLVHSYAPLIDTRIFVFITGLEAVLIGLYVPSNELILERSVYLRERMVNLKVVPYLVSKMVVFGLFAVIQCLLYLAVLSIGVRLPETGIYFPAPVEIYITVLITMLASIGIGLFVSSLARSPEMGMYILVMMLFFQFFFAGIIFDLRDKPVENLSYLTNTRWAMVALGTTVDLEKFAENTIICTDLPNNPMTPTPNDPIHTCFHHPETTEDLRLSYGKEDLIPAWGVLAGMGLFFYLLTGLSIKSRDRV